MKKTIATGILLAGLAYGGYADGIKSVTSPAVRSGYDLNGDKRQDMVVATKEHGVKGKLWLLLRQENGSYKPKQIGEYRIDRESPGLAVGDLNGDGLTDIVVAATGPGNKANVYGFVNDGRGQYVKKLLGSVDSYAGSPSVDVSDINGDKLNDIVVATRDKKEVMKLYLWLNKTKEQGAVRPR